MAKASIKPAHKPSALLQLADAVASVLQDRSSCCRLLQPAGMAVASRARLEGHKHSCNLQAGHQQEQMC